MRLGLAAAVMAALAACDRASPPAEPTPVAAPVVSSAPVRMAPAAPPVAVPPAAPDIALAGVVSFGPTHPQSQALLSRGGAPAEVFHPGDAIAAGWSLRSVDQDHVVIAQGDATRRIDLSSRAPAIVATASSAASAARAAALAKPVPGFMAESAPPRLTATDGQASARNRAFMQGIQERRAAREAPRPP
ncbi:MAG: type II secretion system protein N [Pseudomonadota bacterium]